jgi:Na+/melibiose symporter-like transporter
MRRRRGTDADRSRVALLVALGVDNLGTGMFLPLGLVFATRVVGLGVDSAGAVVAAAALLGFAVPPVAGRLSHRFGPRRVVVLSQLVQAAGAVGYLLAGGAAAVFVAAGLLAVGTQLFYCAVFVMVADVSSDTAKERPFARVAMVRSAAFGLGNLTAAVALAVGGTQSLPWLVAADAVTYVVAAGLLARYVETPPVDHGKPAAGTLAVARDGRYLALIVSSALVGLTIDVALLGGPVYVLDVLHGPAWLPGALLATSTGLSSLLGVRVVMLLRPFRRTSALQAGSLLFAVWAALMAGLQLVPPAGLVPVAWAVWVLIVAGTKVFYPVSGALSEALPPRESRATYMATYQYAFTAAQVVAPAVVALFAVSGWLPWAVLVAAAFGALGVQRALGAMVPPELDRAG